MIYVIPIVVIASIFVIFYLFKDKLIAKTVNSYNSAVAEWQNNKDGVISSFFAQPDEFNLIQDALGDAKVDSMCSCNVKKGVFSKIMKTATTMVTSVETFDMSLCFLVISGNELNFLRSDGSKIIEHSVFDLKALEDVKCAKASTAIKTFKYVMSSGTANTDTYDLSFKSRGESYDFIIYSYIIGFASFTVSKGYSGNGKLGDNPFSRHFKASPEDNAKLMLYSNEIVPKFISQMQSLSK